ncbi:MAG: hypothetical protein AB1461_09190 [Thermodesulfobacteriota bacterium]
MKEKLLLGVVLLENIPAQTGNREICQFFSHIANVTPVAVFQEESRAVMRRFCWVKGKNPFAVPAAPQGYRNRRPQMAHAFDGLFLPCAAGELLQVNFPGLLRPGFNNGLEKQLQGEKWIQNRMRQNRRGGSTKGFP